MFTKAFAKIAADKKKSAATHTGAALGGAALGVVGMHLARKQQAHKPGMVAKLLSRVRKIRK